MSWKVFWLILIVLCFVRVQVKITDDCGCGDVPRLIEVGVSS